jgi:hypothetical protein
VRPCGDDRDEALASAVQKLLVETQLNPDRFFFDWRGGARRAASPADGVYAGPACADFTARITGFAGAAPAHPYWADAQPCTMLIDEVETIWDAIAARDDWAPLEHKIAAIRRMGEAHRAG